MRKHDHAMLNQLIIQVARAHRSIAHVKLAKLGLHPGQEFIMLQLLRQDGQSQIKLAERLGVQAPTVTKMLQRLEAGGFVERRTSPQDQRVSLVYLSKQGRALEKPLMDGWAALEKQSSKGLTAAEKTQLLHLLGRVRDNLGPPNDEVC
jgi:DNA-binding MarR family transcriptional regulator